jgi:ketosteroid isomerase-like protein
MKNFLFTSLLLSLVVLVQGQEFSNPDLQSLLNAERAFSRMSKEENTRAAFLANVTDKSIGFAAGEIKSEKTNWENATAGEEWLHWAPVFLDVSASGDFGYTTGPWSYSVSKQSEKPEGFGEYVTIWEKQPDGVWKILVDVGVNHGACEVDGKPVKTSTIMTNAAKSKGNAQKEMVQAERKLMASLKDKSIRAYEPWLSKEIKFFREGSLPFTRIPEEDLSQVTIAIVGSGTAASGDMGYTYGTITGPIQPGAQPKKTNFVRIWKKENGKEWKVVVDLVS